MILLNVPLPAGTNMAYRIVRRGQYHSLALTLDVRVWKEELELLLQQHRPDWLDDPIPAYRGTKPYTVATAKAKHTVALGIGIVWLFPQTLSWDRDLDGTLKHTLDSVANAWGFNDSHIRAVYLSAGTVPESTSTWLALRVTRKDHISHAAIRTLEERALTSVARMYREEIPHHDDNHTTVRPL